MYLLLIKQQNFRLDKLEALADIKLKLTKMTNFVLERVENIVGDQHFLLISQCFQKPSFPGSSQVEIEIKG